MNELIGLPQVAKILGISRQAAWKLYQNGKLQPAQIAGTTERPRPLFNVTYIEGLKEQRLVAA